MSKNTQLVTYVNRFGGLNIAGFHQLVNLHFSDVFGGIHLLPFFYPIDGADAGYDAHDNGVVDHRLGTWEDIKELGKDFDLMADLIVNHISSESPQFQDVIKNGSKSPYFDLFLRKDQFFKAEDTEGIDKIFKPKPVPPFTTYKLDTGEEYEFWTTFSPQQLDINVKSDAGKDYIKSTLKTFAENGIKYVRFDAIGFAIKKAGTSCFLLPETYQFMGELKKFANELGIIVLVEVHAHFNRQIEASKYVDYVYDFALPPLVLYSFASGQFSQLKSWLNMRPNNCFNVLDTHDGIGINDVESDWEFEGLLTKQQMDFLANQIHENTKGESRKASGTAAQNLDVYHINSTFYDALGQDEFSYLAARAIQLFLPGISQIYYVGLLAETNDMDLLAKTNVGRDINRPYLTVQDIEQDLEKPIVKKLIHLIQLRNNHPALDGKFEYQDTNSTDLTLTWTTATDFFKVHIDLSTKKLQLDFSDSSISQPKTLIYG